MDNEGNLYFGKIIVESIENINSKSSTELKNPFTDTNIKFVHYPDCQQIIIWLPEYFTNYDKIYIIDIATSQMIYNHSINKIINGSVQIIIDSLFIHPGKFFIKILGLSGCIHQILIKKLSENEDQPVVEIKLDSETKDNNDPILYKNGFGNILPNEDLDLREKIKIKTLGKVFRFVEYVSQGREGEVIYHEGFKSIRFYMEFGGNDVVFILNIPAPEEWESQTGFPLDEREEIIHYVAKITQKDQGPSCDYVIHEKEILYKRI